MLDDQLRRRHLVFGGKPLCTVLRPRFLSLDRYRTLQQRVSSIMGAFGRAHEAAMADPALRAQFRLADWEEQLIADDPGFREPSPTSRLDAFVVDETGSMALTEYNAETPAGAAFNDQLTATFADLPVMREFAKRYETQPLPSRHGVCHVLLDAWRQWSGGSAAPRIAIVDWDDVPSRNEFILFQDFFASLGLTCAILDPRELEYQGGRLLGGGGPINLVYKRVLITELVERGGLEQPLVRAVRERAVCMVNPFRAKLLHKKASLAVLCDERNVGLFDSDARAAINAFVPWTRVVEERKTVHAGAKVDLLPYVAERQERFVLKPNDDYGGAGIVLGWTVDRATWEAALRTALAAPYIVQERVPIPSEPYPSYVDGAVRIYDRMLDTAPFVCYGRYMEGCLTRLSTAALLNVTAGGGSTVPTFLVEER